MPFVTLASGLMTDHDVVKEKFSWDDNGFLKKVREGNGREMMKLGYGDQCDYNPNSVLFKEIVWRGNPDRKNRTWNDTPVWRIPTNRWNDLPEDEKNIMWYRFLEFFKKNSNLLTGGQYQETLVFYEPHLDDIVKNEFSTLKKSWHFPLWVLLELQKVKFKVKQTDGSVKEMDIFEHATTRTKVNFQGELSDDFKYMISKDDYLAIKSALQERIDEENETQEEASNPAISVAKEQLVNATNKVNASKGGQARKKAANDDPILTEVNTLKDKAKKVKKVASVGGDSK